MTDISIAQAKEAEVDLMNTVLDVVSRYHWTEGKDAIFLYHVAFSSLIEKIPRSQGFATRTRLHSFLFNRV